MFSKYILLVLDNLKIQINPTLSKVSNFYTTISYNKYVITHLL